MRLLVTRPLPEGQVLAEYLRDLGHSVLMQPLMEIVLAAEPPRLPPPAAIAVTSRNAVRAMAEWPASAEWRRLPVYAVGAATAAAAHEAGFADVRTASGDGAALAAFIRADFAPGLGAILYPAGHDRSVELSEALPEFVVITVEAYRGVAAAALDAEVDAALRHGAVDGVLLFSRRTAEIFVSLATDLIPALVVAKPLFYLLSPQVAGPLRVLPSPRIVVAPQPTEASLLGQLDRAVVRG